MGKIADTRMREEIETLRRRCTSKEREIHDWKVAHENVSKDLARETSRAKALEKQLQDARYEIADLKDALERERVRNTEDETLLELERRETEGLARTKSIRVIVKARSIADASNYANHHGMNFRGRRYDRRYNHVMGIVSYKHLEAVKAWFNINHREGPHVEHTNAGEVYYTDGSLLWWTIIG